MQMEQYQVVSSVGASPSQGQPLAVASADQQQQQQVAVMQSLSGTPIAHVTTAQPQVRTGRQGRGVLRSITGSASSGGCLLIGL